MALAYKHPVEFSKNKHTPNQQPNGHLKRGNFFKLHASISAVKSGLRPDLKHHSIPQMSRPSLGVHTSND